MVLTNETSHVYPFHWDVVTRAFWNKYPNSRLAHVERVDVLDRRIDAEGRLVTTRLAKVTQKNLPGWVRSALGDSTYVFETTVCDPQQKRLVLKSTNLSFRSVATVNETCVYTVHPDNAQKTLYEAEAEVTAFVPFVSRKLESFSGTFQPAFCETVNAANSVAARATEEAAAAAAATLRSSEK
ncbi:hypothetical protein JM18_006134 [Phytophthora kernoviae]|uniref:PRELI/MSF1 domain-containing protein n=1 Tax=Phytophthora kernoviae TaxID=325452 RepID=A0A921SGI2_9STRA|nr:hypothetical protein JM18_006134 [Phytophthora kernoviae]